MKYAKPIFDIKCRKHASLTNHQTKIIFVETPTGFKCLSMDNTVDAKRIADSASGDVVIELTPATSIRATTLSSNGSRMLTFGQGNKLRVVDQTAIMYLVADGAYTDIFPKGLKKIVEARNLKVVEKLLPADLYFRIDDGVTINRLYISDETEWGAKTIKMVDGKEHKISRRKLKPFWKWLAG